MTTHASLRFLRHAAAVLCVALLSACLGGRVDTGTVPSVLMVTTLAGQPGSAGGADGTGSAARFSMPAAVAADSAGNVYVADWSAHVIRKITPQGVVSTVAGKAGEPGIADGPGHVARFNHPQGVAVDNLGNLYVADRENHTIRKITAAGVVSTLAGSPGLGGSADGTGAAASFNGPVSVALDVFGNLYVGEIGGNTVRKVTAAGAVTTLAGSPGVTGSADGAGAAARFDRPLALATDTASNVYVTDFGNNTIRKITPAGVVSTLAGAAGQSGHVDGQGAAARLSGPLGIAVDGQGNVYVSTWYAHAIRRITPEGEVTTLAGKAGVMGHDDGLASSARFVNPVGLAIDPKGLMYLANLGGYTVRKFEPGYLVEGTVTGLQGALILRNSNADTVTVKADGSFTFPMPVAEGKDYAVSVQTLPAGQTCTVEGASGTASNAGIKVEVTCQGNGGSTVAYPIGGVVSGLSGKLELRNANGERIGVLASGAFGFSAPVALGADYDVSVAAQPIGQTCVVSGGSGRAMAAVSNVVVHCAANVHEVGGAVSGLTGGTLVLQNNAADDLPVTLNGSFAFPTRVAFGGAYAVTVKQQPAGQICTVSSSLGAATVSGTVQGDVRFAVKCVAAPVTTYTVGGAVAGLTGGALVLQNNAGDNLPIAADGSFVFATAVAAGSRYDVTVLTQPAGHVCAVLPGSGTGNAAANVTDVAVACMPETPPPPPPPPAGYTVGGTVNGLTSVGLILQNGSDYLPVFPMFEGGPVSFNFATAVPAGTTFNVIVTDQPLNPTPQTCTLTSGGTGTVTNNVSTIVIDCR